MHRSSPLMAVLVAIVCLIAPLANSTIRCAAGADDLTRPIRGQTPSGVPIRFLGTSSCSANACHNAGNFHGHADLDFYEPRPRWEYTYWRRFDPHVRAFEVLHNDQSRRIEKNLRGLSTMREAHPERDGLCLSCHVHQNHRSALHGPEFALTDGVGCESCHGASERWSSAHVRAGWQSLSPSQKADYGFVPLDSLANRARMCVSCHVGSSYEDAEHGLIDVNHDLIAAGHPRLSFEFASYHAQYPKHWSDIPDRLADPAYEARSWVVGQLASAEAALKLLAARADRALREDETTMPRPLRSSTRFDPHSGPWPEFAEYDCFACHHDLRGGVSIAGSPSRTAVPGSLPWGSWFYPMMDAIALELPPPRERWQEVLKAVDDEMTQPAPSIPSVQRHTEDAIMVLDEWLTRVQSHPIDAQMNEALMKAVVDSVRDAHDPSWDRDTQAYLALSALYAAQADLAPHRRNPALGQALEELRRRLEFADAMNSPPDYDTEDLSGLLSIIVDRIGK